MSKTNPANLHFTQWFQWRHWLHRVEPPQIHWNPLQSRNSILFGVPGTNTSHFKANLWLDYRCKVQRHLCSSRICKFFMFFEHLQRDTLGKRIFGYSWPLQKYDVISHHRNECNTTVRSVRSVMTDLWKHFKVGMKVFGLLNDRPANSNFETKTFKLKLSVSL